VFIGDDPNDEHGFAEVNNCGISIKVGKGKARPLSPARWWQSGAGLVLHCPIDH
jgi:trehalose-6-phosphatase